MPSKDNPSRQPLSLLNQFSWGDPVHNENINDVQLVGLRKRKPPVGNTDSESGDETNEEDKNEDDSKEPVWKQKLSPYLPNGMWNMTFAGVPEVSASLALKTVLGVTVALYVLNQSHMLPRPLASLVSKTLFWPTLPITFSRRIGNWCTKIDDTVVMGGAPFGFLNYPDKLYKEYGVRGVINFCEEFKGPQRKYKQLGMEELYLPTTDHFEPSTKDLISAINFIRKHEAQGTKVYVHCRAGHGRSGAAVFAWLLYKDPIVDLKMLNMDLCKLRAVRSTLWKQPNVQEIHQRLLRRGTLAENDEDENGEDSITMYNPANFDDENYDEESEDGMQI